MFETGSLITEAFLTSPKTSNAARRDSSVVCVGIIEIILLHPIRMNIFNKLVFLQQSWGS